MKLWLVKITHTDPECCILIYFLLIIECLLLLLRIKKISDAIFLKGKTFVLKILNFMQHICFIQNNKTKTKIIINNIEKNHSKGISKYEEKHSREVFTGIRKWALEIPWQELRFFFCVCFKYILGFLE